MELVQVKIIGLSISASSGGAYVMLLGEPDGRYRLPIIIGGYEGRAIELGLEQIKPSRPITHDLLCQFLESFDAQVIDIVIHKLHERTFFAEIRYRHNGKEHAMDARPSDAIALAVRLNANIYVSAAVMEEAGIIAESEEVEGKEPEEDLSPVERMEQRLKKAIATENYEEAARLRDALIELKGDEV